MYNSVTVDMSRRDPTSRRQGSARRRGSVVSVWLTTSAAAASLRKIPPRRQLADSVFFIDACVTVIVSFVVGTCNPVFILKPPVHESRLFVCANLQEKQLLFW